MATCPECGSANAELINDGGIFYVQCPDCGEEVMTWPELTVEEAAYYAQLETPTDEQVSDAINSRNTFEMGLEPPGYGHEE